MVGKPVVAVVEAEFLAATEAVYSVALASNLITFPPF